MSEINQQIYTEKKTVVGVLIGGALAGGYFFCRNFRTIGMSTPAVIAPVIALAVLGLTIGTIFVPALDRIPNVVYWGLQIGLTYGLYRAFLARPIEEHLEQGSPEFSWGNTIAVAVISFALTLGIIFAIVFLSDTFSGQSVKHFGARQHEITYEEKNFTPEEVDKIGAALTSAGFFDQEMKKTVDATKDGDRYILNMYCNETARNSEFIELVKGLREDVQHSFPRNPIIIDLVIGTPDNRIARIE